MTNFQRPSLGIIVGAAMFGGVSAFFALFGKEGTAISNSPWAAIIPVILGAALSASAASALCRFFRIYQFLREWQKRIALGDRTRRRSERLSQKIDPNHRCPTESQRPFIELIICEDLTAAREPRSVCRQRLSPHELKSALTSLTNRSELESYLK